MSKSLLRLAIFSAPLLLTACGEGWEAQRTSEYFPYGNQRTAGSGVVYVRTKMLPKKELVVEPAMDKVEEEPSTVEPVLEAEEIFSDAQRKGAPPAKKTEAVVTEEKQSNNTGSAVIEEDKHASIIMPESAEVIEQASVEQASVEEASVVSAVEPASGFEEITAEEYISQAPKRIIAKKVEVIKVSNNQPDSYGFEGEEMVEVFENEVIQPQKEIIVPKKDKAVFLSVGEEALNEIYNSDF